MLRSTAHPLLDTRAKWILAICGGLVLGGFGALFKTMRNWEL